MRFHCLRTVILTLTYHLYYFHGTQRFPRNFTEEDDSSLSSQDSARQRDTSTNTGESRKKI